MPCHQNHHVSAVYGINSTYDGNSRNHAVRVTIAEATPVPSEEKETEANQGATKDH